MIFFDPDPTNGTIGSQGFATIANGTYTTAKRGRGVRGGAYVIRISGFDGALANDDQPVRPLFEDYVVTRDIPTSATQLNFDVPASGKKDVRP